MAVKEKQKQLWNDALRKSNIISESDEVEDGVMANYYESILNGSQGDLLFTKERLVYVAKGLLNKNVSILYSDVRSLRTCMAGLMPIGIEITVFDSESGKDKKYLFGVMNRKQWISLLWEKTGLK
jgi:hypothetical protein